jgi:hypothetical protein
MDYIATHYHMDLALAWSLRLEGKTDQEKFKELSWGLRTWDHWYFNDIAQRFGDSWPARYLPARALSDSLRLAGGRARANPGPIGLP